MTRSTPYPTRHQFDAEVRSAVDDVFAYYDKRGQDFGGQGHFEERYTREFIHFQGDEGYCDAVSSGTAALYIALGALELPEGASVLVSPIADPGCLSAIILNRLKPKLLDCGELSYNVTFEEFRKRVGSDVKGALLVHAAGTAIREIGPIAKLCAAKGIGLIEDCSQAQGARVDGRRVGTFGDIAAVSTMSTKSHSSGGNGGLLYTRSKELYDRMRMLADRGKPFHEKDFEPGNPATFKIPALNLPQDELSCAIGEVTLRRLDRVRAKRVELLQHLERRLEHESASCRLYPVSGSDSPFFWPVLFDPSALGCDKAAFTVALMALGVLLSPHYRFLVQDWPWVHRFLFDRFRAEKAEHMIGRSFNLLFHEQFTVRDMDDIAEAILEVERASLKSLST